MLDVIPFAGLAVILLQGADTGQYGLAVGEQGVGQVIHYFCENAVSGLLRVTAGGQAVYAPVSQFVRHLLHPLCGWVARTAHRHLCSVVAVAVAVVVAVVAALGAAPVPVVAVQQMVRGYPSDQTSTPTMRLDHLGLARRPG